MRVYTGELEISDKQIAASSYRLFPKIKRNCRALYQWEPFQQLWDEMAGENACPDVNPWNSLLTSSEIWKCSIHTALTLTTKQKWVKVTQEWVASKISSPSPANIRTTKEDCSENLTFSTQEHRTTKMHTTAKIFYHNGKILSPGYKHNLY